MRQIQRGQDHQYEINMMAQIECELLTIKQKAMWSYPGKRPVYNSIFSTSM